MKPATITIPAGIVAAVYEVDMTRPESPDVRGRLRDPYYTKRTLTASRQQIVFSSLNEEDRIRPAFSTYGCYARRGYTGFYLPAVSHTMILMVPTRLIRAQL